MKINLAEAYACACQKIGEGVVREAAFQELLGERDAEIASLREKLQAAGLIEEATEIVEGASDANQRVDQGRSGGDEGLPEPPSEG